QALIHVVQGTLFRRDPGLRAAAVAPRVFQQTELEAHIAHLGRIGDACGLDPENGDLVEQLAGRDGDQDVVHEWGSFMGANRNNSSSLPVTSPTLIRSITPGFSILRVQGSACGVAPQKRWAAWAYESIHHCLERYGPLRAGLVAA